jgi:hypothetical protein
MTLTLLLSFLLQIQLFVSLEDKEYKGRPEFKGTAPNYINIFIAKKSLMK